MSDEKYVVEDPRIVRQMEYAESLISREFTDTERQIFEWAYTQGREDVAEGK